MTPPLSAQSRRFAAAILAALLIPVPTEAALAASRAPRARTSSVTLTSVAVSGSRLAIAGRVVLAGAAARGHRRIELTLTLAGIGGHTERFVAHPGSRERFSVVHETSLTGELRLRISLEVSGRTVGRALTRDVHVAIATPLQPPAGSSTTPASTTPASTTPGEGTKASGPAPLVGTFDLTAATNASVPKGGSWFEMLDPDRVPLENPNSPLTNKDFTPLTGGVAGGLSTAVLQPAPSPAFSEEVGGKGHGGSALADAIMQPQNFFGDNFSIVTASTDLETGEADPLPAVTDDNGRLSGQVTAWVVGWNGNWFNQGTPKPNGTLPEGTTALSGEYDSATGVYQLEWQSLIVGPTFNGFLGVWHLEGTFVPAG